MKGVQAVFPGSFDPFTRGHFDILERSTNVFSVVHVSVLSHGGKHALFSPEKRVELIQECCAPLGSSIQVHLFDGLLVEFARSIGVRVVIRGLRAISDYDYEAQLALANKKLSKEIETFFLTTSEPYSYVSSTLVKQIAKYHGDVSAMVLPPVAKALEDAFKDPQG